MNINQIMYIVLYISIHIYFFTYDLIINDIDYMNNNY